jgi:hypothetical protein
MAELAVALRGSPQRDVVDQATEALDAGFSKLGLLSPIDDRSFARLRTALAPRSFCCVELFLPYRRRRGLGQPDTFRLGSPDAEDRRDAVTQGGETIRFAAANEIATVLVPVVRLDPELRRAQTRAWSLPRSQAVLDAIDAARAEEAPRKLDALRAVLSRLLDLADRYSVVVALGVGGWSDELPNAVEVAACLREFRGAPLMAWCDTLSYTVSLEEERRRAAETPAASGAEDALANRGLPFESDARTAEHSTVRGSPWNDLKVSLGPATVSDKDDRGAASRPGEGELDWKLVLPLLEACTPWLLDPPWGTPSGLLRGCREFLEGLGRSDSPFGSMPPF